MQLMHMRTTKAIFLVSAVISLVTFGQVAGGEEEDIDLFRRDLVSVAGCTCGCDLILNVCEEDMPDCTTRPAIMKKIEISLKEGKPNLLSVVGCPCGCDMTLAICEKEDPTCPIRPEAIEKIKQLIIKHGVEKRLLDNLGLSMSPAEKAMAKAQAEDKYIFLHFYEEGTKDSKKMSDVIKKASLKWKEKADFVSIEINDENEREIINRYRIRRVPLTLAIAPNGAVTSGFPGVVALDRLGQAFISPKMAEVIKAIQQKKTIFLCLANSQTKYSNEVLEASQEAIKMLSGIAELIEVDPKDKGEEFLLAQLRVDPDIDTATTVVIAPTGIIVDKFTGLITKRDLFDSFQKILAMESGCGQPTATGGSACQPERGTAGESTCR